MNDSEEEEDDFEPDASHINETTVQQEIMWFDDKLGADTQYSVIQIPSKKRQVRLKRQN